MILSRELSKRYLTANPFRPIALSDYGNWLDKAEFSHTDPLFCLQEIALRFKPGDLVLVSGSLYLVGDLRHHLLAP